MSPPLTLIAAVARNGGIGYRNQLLWQLPGDMAHFRRQTAGQPVIMGRKTWESLPPRFRPLPGRLNIVISRQPNFAAPGAELVTSLPAAIDRARQAETPRALFVIGGAEIYRQSLPLADQLILTEVDDAPPADSFFPPVAAEIWQEISREVQQETGCPAYAFVTYQRRRP